MFSKKTWVIVTVILSMIFHFIFYFNQYGNPLRSSIVHYGALLGTASVMILIYLYLWTRWRVDITSGFIAKLYDLTMLWFFICFIRSLLTFKGSDELKELLFDPYIGLSLFAPLFFLVGINKKYFSVINKLLMIYCGVMWLLALRFFNYPEYQVFLIMPIFYLIVTFPLQTNFSRILTLMISISVVYSSLSNRAGIIRLLVSYFVVIAYWAADKINLNKKLIIFFTILVLISPFYLLTLGIQGKDVFQMLTGTNEQTGYGAENIKADTRTFLYKDVFRDLKVSKAYVFGKGINAGYETQSFETFNRTVVEVGFLQILLKSGIFGFLLYLVLIISAIFRTLNKSQNLFMKYLSLMLAGYVLLLFIENIIGYNLFNIVIWIVVGMCHSDELLALNNDEIKELFLNGEPELNPELS